MNIFKTAKTPYNIVYGKKPVLTYAARKYREIDRQRVRFLSKGAPYN
jgi:hypothetical protein